MQIHSGQLKWVIRTMVNGTMIHGQHKEDNIIHKLFFYLNLNLYICIITNKTKIIMKTSAFEIGFKVWSIGLGVLAFTGIAIAVFNLITGNYCSTASFEF
jgi:hypothetical protein